jgi:hypothetical protein
VAHPDYRSRTFDLALETNAQIDDRTPAIDNPAQCFSESVRLFARLGLQGERARTLRAWARYEIESGDRVRGELLWREVRAVVARLGMDGDVRQMDAFLTLPDA